MREDFIAAHLDAVHEFTDMLVQSGQFIARKPETAAEIGVDFLDPDKKLGLNVAVLKNVLKEPEGIKTDDLFPVIADLDRIQRYMVEEMGIGSIIDLEKFVDARFAEAACENATNPRRSSVIHDVSRIVSRITNQQRTEVSSKTKLDREGKYLMFSLDNQEFGAGILSVKEIIGMRSIRSIPQAPAFVKGAINLRGTVIPIIDLRLKFGMAPLDYSERTCIMVMEIGGKDGVILVGIVVDSVSEVLNIKAAEIEDTSVLGAAAHTDFILGMANMDGGVKILLDVPSLLSQGECDVICSIN